MFYVIFQNMASQHHAWQLGILDDDEWAENRTHAKAYARSEVTRELWTKVGTQMFAPDFVEFMAEIIEEVAAEK